VRENLWRNQRQTRDWPASRTDPEKCMNNNMKQLLKLLFGAGLLLVDANKREKAAGNFRDRMDDWRDTAKDKYEDAVDRLERIAYAARGEEPWTSKAAPFLVGLGLGIGAGILFAPASGQETRDNLSQRADNVRNRVSEKASTIRGRVSEQIGNLNEKIREATRETTGSGEGDRVSRPA
jgi:gas vesicle protein